MARFETDGLDEIIDYMTSLEMDTGPMADAMLLAGAEQVKLAWKQSATQHGLKDTGAMIDSIDYARHPTSMGHIKSIDIYPKGKDRKGVSNAEKAFILHFGTKSSGAKKRRKNKKYPGPGIPATHWVDDADAAAGPLVEEEMVKVMGEFLDK